MLAQLLRDDGHTVTEAEDGEEGVAKIADESPELALVDVGLPKMNGYELARAVREGGYPTLLIALTGYGRTEDKQAVREAGFRGHLIKPLSMDRLYAVLREATNKP